MPTRPRHRLTSLAALPALALLLPLAACGGQTEPEVPSASDDDPVAGIPAYGDPGSFEMATWNLEWFGDPERGPDDEALQLQNVRTVFDALDVDLWSVQEVTHADHFEALLSGLPGYAGFLANDPSVEGGAASYSDFDDTEQKVGLVYRTDMLAVVGARVILADFDHEFAGRPPVEVRLSTDGDDGDAELVVILLHAKAGDGVDDRERRVGGAAALRAYLDTTWPDAAVAVVGDFNDDVDTSITDGYPSSYAGFVEDPGYVFPTAVLSERGVSSTVFYPDVIDHQMATDDFMAAYVEGSAEVARLLASRRAGAMPSDWSITNPSSSTPRFR